MPKPVKYACNVKVGPDRWLWYHYVDNFLTFTAFLDKAFPDWRYYNVYDKESGLQVENFTKKKRPNRPTL